MIFNLSQGGLAYISVTAPSGASITAECLGLTVTGTGTCTLEAPVIGTWTVTSVLDNTPLVNTVDVESYGETYTTSFSYTATITVTTHPSSSVTAAKTGQTSLSGTADENGECILTVPAGGLGEWSVTATNSSSVSESATVNVLAYGGNYPISLLSLVPVITVVIGDDTYTYNGVEINETGVKISPVGTTGWKMWMKATGTITFNSLNTNVDVCVVGKGAKGGNCNFDGAKVYCGSGGSGGMVKNSFGQTLSVGQQYSASIGDGTDFAGILSAGVGGGASGGGGGSTTPEGGPRAAGSGREGSYAFGDSTFDGIKYGHGGGGGIIAYYGGGTGSRDSNPGAGGGGGGQVGQGSSSPSDGRVGIVLMRNAS